MNKQSQKNILKSVMQKYHYATKQTTTQNNKRRHAEMSLCEQINKHKFILSATRDIQWLSPRDNNYREQEYIIQQISWIYQQDNK